MSEMHVILLQKAKIKRAVWPISHKKLDKLIAKFREVCQAYIKVIRYEKRNAYYIIYVQLKTDIIM